VAIILDDKAREAIARRRAQGRDHTLYLRIERMPGTWGRAAGIADLSVSWAPRRLPDRGLVVRSVGDTVICVDSRVARYAAWHDVTISAWRLGPFDRLMVDPTVLFELQAWERTHPRPEHRTA
jgi:hypothetical protein